MMAHGEANSISAWMKTRSVTGNQSAESFDDIVRYSKLVFHFILGLFNPPNFVKYRRSSSSLSGRILSLSMSVPALSMASSLLR